MTHGFQYPEDQQLFLYYKCYRANVRAKVHALGAAQTHDLESYQHHLKAWRKYLQLIKRYMGQVEI